ncbi:hypothetical protein PhCBS80983_g04920 [Powellomyces hirtus]|uniref:DUF4219 domain-containing protein n=1 Tax=Powellomyces hirtus TaxID=109895 RepID=A0A507DX58_9FUNG|nr:hypothetical protein PhCBS80983_g04920 [Powellomyces hirtus]
MSSGHDTGLLTIGKFTGKNFHLWNFRLQAMLKAKGLWSAIEWKLPLDACDQDACRKEEKDIRDEQLMHVQTAATAAEVWRKLKVVHERQVIANKLYLKCKFLTVVMEDGDGMLAHINKVKMMAHQLGVIEAKADSEDIVITLLYSLPESFELLIVSLESRADDLTLESLTAKFEHEETCCERAIKAYRLTYLFRLVKRHVLHQGRCAS